jgi:hypothetical protein
MTAAPASGVHGRCRANSPTRGGSFLPESPRVPRRVRASTHRAAYLPTAAVPFPRSPARPQSRARRRSAVRRRTPVDLIHPSTDSTPSRPAAATAPNLDGSEASGSTEGGACGVPKWAPADAKNASVPENHTSEFRGSQFAMRADCEAIPSPESAGVSLRFSCTAGFAGCRRDLGNGS